MKIRKTDIPGLDTKAKIDIAKNIHESEYKDRTEKGINKQYTQHIKIRDLYLHIQNGGEWEFIDKTIEEEDKDKQIEAEKKAEQEKKDRILLAKDDGVIRDQLITQLMNEAGFTPDKIILAQVQESKDSKDMSQFWSDRASKLTEIKAMIDNA